MKKYIFAAIVAVLSLSACDQGAAQAYKPPPHIRDKQIVCALNGDSYIYLSDDSANYHTVRSPETDPLCQPLKAIIKFKPDTGASQ